MSGRVSLAGRVAVVHCLRTEVGHKGVGVGVAYLSLSWTDTDMVRGADQDDVMRDLRQRLPWPARKAYPLGPAVDRLVAGSERRSAHVYGQWWLRGMQGVRGYLPGILATVGRRDRRRFEPRLSDVRTGLVGAGGAADERERGASPHRP